MAIEDKEINCLDYTLSTKSEICDQTQKYYERKIGKTIYRVTNIHKGEIDIAKALENLIVRQVLNDIAKIDKN